VIHHLKLHVSAGEPTSWCFSIGGLLVDINDQQYSRPPPEDLHTVLPLSAYMRCIRVKVESARSGGRGGAHVENRVWQKATHQGEHVGVFRVE